MIDYKLIEQRLTDALDKETTESLLEWLKNHEDKQPEPTAKSSVDCRVILQKTGERPTTVFRIEYEHTTPSEAGRLMVLTKYGEYPIAFYYEGKTLG